MGQLRTHRRNAIEPFSVYTCAWGMSALRIPQLCADSCVHPVCFCYRMRLTKVADSVKVLENERGLLCAEGEGKARRWIQGYGCITLVLSECDARELCCQII